MNDSMVGMAGNIGDLIVTYKSSEAKDISGILAGDTYPVVVHCINEFDKQVLKKLNPYLVILHFTLAEAAALEICRQISTDSLLTDLPVVFVGTTDNDDFILNAFEAGGADVVSHPFTEKELLCRIGKYIRQYKRLFDLKKMVLGEEHVKNLQSRIRQFLENNLNEIYIFDEETLNFLYVNQRALFNIGYTLEEMNGLTPENILIPKISGDEFFEIIKPLISGANTNVVFETNLKRKNGSVYPVELNIQRQEQVDRNLFFVTANDLSLRRVAEDALKDSEQMLRLSLEVNNVSVFENNFVTGAVKVTPELFRFLGYMPDEQPKTIEETINLIHPDDVTVVREALRNHFEGKSSEYFVEYRIRMKSGEWRWIDGRGKVISWTENHKPVVLLGTSRDIHEYKLATDLLRENEEQHHAFFDTSADMMFVKDDQLRYLMANKSMANFFGKTTEEVLNKTDEELANQKRIYPCKSSDEKALKTKSPFKIVEKLGDRFYETTKFPLRLKDNKPGIGGIMRDITQQKAAYETIQILSKGIEQSPSMVVITDIHGKIEYVNPKFTEITGYGLKHVIGKKPSILNPKKHHIYSDLRETLYSGKIWRGEFTDRKKNGALYTEYVVISPIIDKSGVVTNILINSEDITKKKKEEQILNVIHGITQDGATSKNLEDLIAKVRTRLSELIDVTNFYLALYDEATDMFTLPLFSDQKDDISKFKAGKSLTAYVLRSKRPFLGTEKDIKKLKKKGLVESIGVSAKVWLGIPIMTGEKVLGVFVVQSYENEKAFNQQDMLMLEAVAREISYTIQQLKSDDEIRRALKKAEENDRLKSEFLANISHEIRTPLNSIIGFSDLLLDPAFNLDQKYEFIRHVVSNGNNLLNIINDIMDISKIESGQISIRRGPVRVSCLISSLKMDFASGFQEKNIELRFVDPESDDLFVFADVERLRQVFNNLLSNALKFTSKGHVEVSYYRVGNMIQFRVDDTGIGIPHEYHSIVFDRFRQVDSSLSRKFGGNGLGLAITKNLVELMDGNIWLESEPGKGTSFYFNLPEV